MIPEIAADCPSFKLIEFNPRRRMRGARAARVQVADDGDWVWMDERDLRKNVELFGPHQGLLDAQAAYKRAGLVGR